MILDDTEVVTRLNSPLNLLNRLKNASSKNDAMSTFGVEKNTDKTSIVTLPPSVDELVDSLEDKLSESSLVSKASNVISAALDELLPRLGEVSKPRDLAQIAANVRRVIGDKRGQSEGNKNVIIYKPVIVNESHFEVVQAVD